MEMVTARAGAVGLGPMLVLGAAACVRGTLPSAPVGQPRTQLVDTDRGVRMYYATWL